ncbi:hypothetical protein SSS_05981, partial [Sarcoptes scabiei]
MIDETIKTPTIPLIIVPVCTPSSDSVAKSLKSTSDPNQSRNFLEKTNLTSCSLSQEETNLLQEIRTENVEDISSKNEMKIEKDKMDNSSCADTASDNHSIDPSLTDHQFSN